MRGPTVAQIKILHVLRNVLRMSKDDWEAALSSYLIKSSKDLTFDQAKEMIESLEQAAIGAGVWVKKGERPGRATQAQLAKIRLMWDKVSRADPGEARIKALNRFVSRYGADRVEWLPRERVFMVIKAIEAMIQNKKEESDEHEQGI
jgi:hypothetical protein